MGGTSKQYSWVLLVHALELCFVLFLVCLFVWVKSYAWLHLGPTHFDQVPVQKQGFSKQCLWKKKYMGIFVPHPPKKYSFKKEFKNFLKREKEKNKMKEKKKESSAYESLRNLVKNADSESAGLVWGLRLF